MSIYDFPTISAILDCSEVSITDHPYRLMSCTDITTHQIVDISDGVVTVMDSQRLSTAIAWLIGQGIIADGFTETDMVTLLTGARDANLRAGELIKIMLFISMNASSEYAPSGFNSGRYVPVTVRSPVTSGGIANASGYSVVEANGTYVDDHGVTCLWDYTAPGVRPLNRSFGAGKYVYNRPKPGTGSLLAYCGAGRGVPYTGSITYEAGVVFQRPDGIVQRRVTWGGSGYRAERDGYIEGYIRMHYDRNSFEFVTRSYNAEGNLLSVASSDEIPIEAPIIGGYVDTSVNGQYFTINLFPSITKCFAMPETVEGTAGLSLLPISYIPDVRYDGPVYTGLGPTTQDGVTYTLTGRYTNDATFTVTGTIDSNGFEVPYLANPRPFGIEIVRNPGIVVPTVIGDASGSIPVQMRFDSRGYRHLGRSQSVAGSIALATEFQPSSLPATIARAISTYDTQSVFEDFSSISAEAISVALGSKASITDPYLANLFDYTVTIMCSDQVSNIRAYMLDDQGMLYDTWGERYFEDHALEAGQSIPVFTWSRVRLSDSTEYASVQTPPAGLLYDSGRLIATADVNVHIENFVWRGLSLDEWWQVRNTDAAAPFYSDLGVTQTESDTQVLLHQALNGVVNATNWLSDVGQILSDAIADAKAYITDVITGVGEANITTAQRYALLGSVADIAVPATRVSELLTTAANMGATSANEVLKVLDMIPESSGSRYGIAQVTQSSARNMMDIFTAINPTFGHFKLNCTTPKVKSTDISYGSTFLDRMGSSIISAGGVSCEVTDVGEGVHAIYPAILNGTVYLPDADLGITGPIVLPMRSSVVCIYPTQQTSGYTVAWHAKHNGGSDYDVVQSIDAALDELSAFMNAIGSTLSEKVSYVKPNITSETYVGKARDVDLVNYASAAAIGATAGAAIGLVGTPLLSAALGGVGAAIGLASAAWCNYTRSNTVTDNLEYQLNRLDGNAGTMVIGQGSTSDASEIGFAMATFVMAAVAHGAYYPYGYPNLHDLSIPDRFAVLCPGNPYFKYVYTGADEDYTPLIITGLALLSTLQVKTLIKAFRNPTRNPSFLPIMLGQAAFGTAAGIMSRAGSAIAISREPTLDMQRRILDSVSSLEAGSGGVYTDAEGVVSLRDIQNAQILLEQKLNTLTETVRRTGQTALPY